MAPLEHQMLPLVMLAELADAIELCGMPEHPEAGRPDHDRLAQGLRALVSRIEDPLQPPMTERQWRWELGLCPLGATHLVHVCEHMDDEWIAELRAGDGS